MRDIINLMEIFSSESGWVWQTNESDYCIANFIVDGKKYAVVMKQNGNVWDISFGDLVNNDKSINLTPTGDGASIKVMSAVVVVIKAFVAEHQPSAIGFETPSGERNNRVKLYRAMANRLAQIYNAKVKTFSEDNYSPTEFLVKLK